jgi:ABC-type spermidine/putrescine transport system permease subunit I
MTSRPEATSVESSHRGARLKQSLHPIPYLITPIGMLLVFFIAPLIILLIISFRHQTLYGSSTGFTLDNFRSLISSPLYRQVAIDTIVIATFAMAVQLVLAIPTAYIMAFRAGRFELPILLALVLADELNPIIRIYAWRMLLGREGLINYVVQAVGLRDQPIDWLLFSKFAVVVVLSTSWVPYTTIPIYAAMKAINPNLFESAIDLGAGWPRRWRTVLVPLAAPGIVVAIILVYIPLFTEFATPALVGGPTSYMLGNSVADLMLTTGDWGKGAALSLMLLAASAGVAVAAYFAARLNQID